MPLPFREFRISLLNPGEVLGPFISAAEKMGQVPFVGVGQIGAGKSFRSGHVENGRETESREQASGSESFRGQACNARALVAASLLANAFGVSGRRTDPDSRRQ